MRGRRIVCAAAAIYTLLALPVLHFAVHELEEHEEAEEHEHHHHHHDHDDGSPLDHGDGALEHGDAFLHAVLPVLLPPPPLPTTLPPEAIASAGVDHVFEPRPNATRGPPA